MANVQTERAWLQRMAEEAQARRNERAEQAQREWAEQERKADLGICGKCGHTSHDYFQGTDDCFLWCADESCLCGVPACPQCGAHERARNVVTIQAPCYIGMSLPLCEQERALCRVCGYDFPQIAMA